MDANNEIQLKNEIVRLKASLERKEVAVALHKGAADRALELLKVIELQVSQLKDIADDLHGRACECGGSGKCEACGLFSRVLAMGTERPKSAPVGEK